MTRKKNRKPRAEKPDLRAEIDVLALIRALERHVLGGEEGHLSSTQVSAARTLLKKALPDMTESALRGGDDGTARLAHEDALSALE